MTMLELSERYEVDIGKLQYFVRNHLIEEKAEYSGEELQQLGNICMLHEAGMDTDEIKNLLSLNRECDQKEIIRILSKHRSAVLDEIHKRQKYLDQIDYMIYKLKGSDN
jgi:DNA-binding transcriptional MerR regulator